MCDTLGVSLSLYFNDRLVHIGEQDETGNIIIVYAKNDHENDCIEIPRSIVEEYEEDVWE